MFEMIQAIVRTNGVTKEKQDYIQNKKLSPYELIRLKDLGREELRALMFFCEIRVFEGTPVVALSDDEMRMAYLVWRGRPYRERDAKRRARKKKVRNFTEFVKREIWEEFWK